jgi:adenine-specific DNA-methyltransferase
VEFLGSKRALTGFLLEAIDVVRGREPHVADLFCGTASVSVALEARGWQVTANDSLQLCSTFAEAALLYEEPAGFSSLDRGYTDILDELNRLEGRSGFIHKHYSPAGRRMYLTEENAMRVDAIRAQIREWDPYLTHGERARLLVDLVRAVSAVSNTAGTFGCYFKHWKTRALAPLSLTPARAVQREGRRLDHAVHCRDAEELAPDLSASVVYADPPYTKRQYAAYYHLLETIVIGDEPTLTGSTGLRPWREKASAWCYRRRAPGALRNLVESLRCDHFFLSYNEDGQISDEEIRQILAARGRLNVREIRYPRYRSSALPHKGHWVRERLYHLALV